MTIHCVFKIPHSCQNRTSISLNIVCLFCFCFIANYYLTMCQFRPNSWISISLGAKLDKNPEYMGGKAWEMQVVPHSPWEIIPTHPHHHNTWWGTTLWKNCAHPLQGVQRLGESVTGRIRAVLDTCSSTLLKHFVLAFTFICLLLCCFNTIIGQADFRYQHKRKKRKENSIKPLNGTRWGTWSSLHFTSNVR